MVGPESIPSDDNSILRRRLTEARAALEEKARLLESAQRDVAKYKEAVDLFDARWKEWERNCVTAKMEIDRLIPIAKRAESAELQVESFRKLLERLYAIHSSDVAVAGDHPEWCDCPWCVVWAEVNVALLPKGTLNRVDVCGKMAGCALEIGHSGLCSEKRLDEKGRA